MLSVCVIGRNEEANLPRLIESLSVLSEQVPFPVETIFVDSASKDRTAAIAKSYFDRVLVVAECKDLCASAGRHVGTQDANGEWILYLDGDMTLCKEFIQAIVQHVGLDDQELGCIGEYIFEYHNGETRRNVLGNAGTSNTAAHFGGAVLLPREAVLRAGNWNPGLYSNEEIELHTRLKAVGCRVRFVNVPMIRHHTEKHSVWRNVWYQFVPSAKGLGKKYYGFGQALAARARAGNVFSFVRAFPYLFAYFVALVSTAVCFTAGAYWLAALVFLAGAYFVQRAKGLRFVVIYAGLIMQGLLGWRKYAPTFIPTIAEKWTRSMEGRE